MGKTIRNDNEMHVEWWLDELKDNGYIDDWDRESEEFNLFPSYHVNKKVYHKTKLPTTQSRTLVQGMKYNYDYRIFWNQKSAYIFFNPGDFSDRKHPPVMFYDDTFFYADFKDDKWVSYVDAKPPSRGGMQKNMNSFITFPLKQKILLWLHGVYINKIIPVPMKDCGDTNILFPHTFTPKRYLITKGGKMTRKINFTCRSLTEYVGERKMMIDSITRQVKGIKDKVIKQGELFK